MRIPNKFPGKEELMNLAEKQRLAVSKLLLIKVNKPIKFC